jgi:hypothetical protein
VHSILGIGSTKPPSFKGSMFVIQRLLDLVNLFCIYLVKNLSKNAKFLLKKTSHLRKLLSNFRLVKAYNLLKSFKLSGRGRPKPTLSPYRGKIRSCTTWLKAKYAVIESEFNSNLSKIGDINMQRQKSETSDSFKYDSESSYFQGQYSFSLVSEDSQDYLKDFSDYDYNSYESDVSFNDSVDDLSF